MKKNRGSNKVRTGKPPRVQERNCVTDGVYNNNYFMHAATSHVGTVVQVETVQGAVYEGIFKTFSHDFHVVLELAHKIDLKDPQKLNANEVVENLIFKSEDIVNMCAQNIEPEYAFNSNSFQIDSCISKFNGEISGEKDLQPWEDPLSNGGEECVLETTDETQNGWDVDAMFSANEKFGVQTSYDDTLAAYTCQINRKDTKDFKEDEAKAARIAMEIERNPHSQNRLQLENGDNEEDLYAAVSRPGNDNDSSKYVPPAKRNSQHHRSGGSGGNPRMNYPSNGNGRPPKNSAAPQPRYLHPTSQQYHPQAYGAHPSAMRDGGNRSADKNNQMCPPAGAQPQNMSSYSANVHGQRSYPPNTVPVTNHSQNAPLQQSKSQRTSPISANPLPNGNADYQPKSLPSVSQSPPHQYLNQNQPSQNSGNNVVNTQQQRKHHQAHHHHTNSRVREDQINELKKFKSNFNLPYDMENKDTEAPKQIQVVSNRNKSPPVSQNSAGATTERNVVAVTIVPTLTLNKFSTSGPATMPQPVVGGVAASTVTTASGHSPSGPPVASVPTTQVGLKQPPLVLQQAGQYQSPIHLQQRDSQVLLQHPQHPQHLQPPMNPTASAHPHHPQQMPPMPQQQPMMQQKVQKVHQVSLHQPAVLPPQTPVQMHHPATTPQQTKSVITVQNNTPAVAVANASQPIVNQSAVTPQQSGVSSPQPGVLPPNVHQRPPLQQQPPPLKSQTSTSSSSDLSPPALTSEGVLDADSAKAKDSETSVEDVSQRVKNVRLNPDAKEYIPAVKSFTPVSRSPSTPTQSRPHTPQTPSSYNIHPGNAPVGTGIPMMMPAYVLTSSPGYVPPQVQNRIRKAPVNSHRTSEFHPSNIPVSAVTGQPLLAPAPPVAIAQSHIGHGTSFSVPAYAHHPQLAAASPYSPLQMIRMVQPVGMSPLVPSTISYHDSSGSNPTTVYVNQGNSAAVAVAQHTPHVHHSQQHPPPSTAPSPSQTPQGPSQSHAPNNYQHPQLAAQSASPYTSIMCPVIQAPPTHGPPHHMVAAQAQSHTMQQYMSQHPSVTPQPHIVSIIPHSCS